VGKKLRVPKKISLFQAQIVGMTPKYKSPRFLNFADRLSRNPEQATKNKAASRIDNDLVAMTTLMSMTDFHPLSDKAVLIVFPYPLLMAT